MNVVDAGRIARLRSLPFLFPFLFPVVSSVALAASIVVLCTPLATASAQSGEGSTEASDPTGVASASGQKYLAYNVWFERPDRIFSVNYQRGTLLKAGDAVSNLDLDKGWRRSRIEFHHDRLDRDLTIYFTPKHHPGVTPEEFFERLFTSKPLSELTRGMTALERENIAAGKTAPGMSREAVIIAQGYPPEHRTPDREGSTWIYWQNRFATKALEFGADGRLE